ncbi:MAG: DinB family protein [Bacteroidota bacterium]
MRPSVNEYAPEYQSYIDLVKGDEIISVLEAQADEFTALVKSISEEKKTYTYAEGKWSIAEVLGHIIDSERIMTFRALWFARNAPNPLPGFEQDDFVQYAGSNSSTLSSLTDEWVLLRKSNILLFKGFDEDALARHGIANNNDVSVLALLFIIAGHLIHHANILKERYLNK